NLGKISRELSYERRLSRKPQTGTQAAAIMHREKCAWGQTGQKNVMALLVLMADLVCELSALRYRHITSNLVVLIAGMTSSRLRWTTKYKNGRRSHSRQLYHMVATRR
ncbi:hypothetical protein X777_14176, partial [Ooceraea biroi]